MPGYLPEYDPYNQVLVPGDIPEYDPYNQIWYPGTYLSVYLSTHTLDTFLKLGRESHGSRAVSFYATISFRRGVGRLHGK